MPTISQVATLSQVFSVSSSNTLFVFTGIKHNVNSSLWNYRQERPHQVILEQVFRHMNMINQSNTSYSLYNACQMRKSHRLSLITTHYRFMVSFDIVHMDIWDLSLILSSNGMNYFLLFTNGCTRNKCIFIMNDKGYVSQLFHHF